MTKSELTLQIKKLAKEAGFADIGIASAADLQGKADFKNWLASGYNAGMDYLAKNLDKRYSPSSIFESARSVICLLTSYAPSENELRPRNKLIASYAQGRDYHKVLKKRAHKLCDSIKNISSDFEGRAFVDTAPIAERQLAVRAGLGWLGKSGIFISPQFGNQVFLTEIICNLELEYDSPCENSCGACNVCIASCPGQAIMPNGKIDANKCLSYHTIENRGEIPVELFSKLTQSVFGCDICVTSCRFNKSALPGDNEFAPTENCYSLNLEELLDWSYDDWDKFTAGGARRRATFEMYLRSAILLAANSRAVNQNKIITKIQAIAKQNPNLLQYANWAIKNIEKGNQR